MHTNPVSPNASQPMLTPPGSVVVPSAAVDGIGRSHFSKAGEAAMDAASHVAAGLKRPLARLGYKVAAGPAASMQKLGDSPYLKLIEPFHTVFLVNDAVDSILQWARIHAVLGQVLPLAALHDSDGPDVMLTNGVPTQLPDGEQVGQFMRRLQRSGSTTAADMGTFASNYVQNYGRIALDQSIKPLNLIVLSDAPPSAASMQTIISDLQALESAQKGGHPVHVHFCLVGADKDGTLAPDGLPDGVEITAVDGAIKPRPIAEQVLVGKIGTWAKESL